MKKRLKTNCVCSSQIDEMTKRVHVFFNHQLKADKPKRIYAKVFGSEMPVSISEAKHMASEFDIVMR